MRKIIAKMKNTKTPIDGHELYLYESDTGLGWVVGSWKKNVDHHMMNTIQNHLQLILRKMFSTAWPITKKSWMKTILVKIIIRSRIVYERFCCV